MAHRKQEPEALASLRPETTAYLDHINRQKSPNPARWSEDVHTKAVVRLAKACGHTGTREALLLLQEKAKRHSEAWVAGKVLHVPDPASFNTQEEA